QLAKGNLTLKWWATTSYWGGAPPPPEVLKAANKSAAGIVQVNLDTGKIEMKQDDKLERPTSSGLQPLDKLPKDVQEVAKREKWQLGVVIGPRAYGKVEKAAQVKPGVFGGVQNFLVQAVDLKSGKLLWERVYEEQRIIPPPP